MRLCCVTCLISFNSKDNIVHLASAADCSLRELIAGNSDTVLHLNIDSLFAIYDQVHYGLLFFPVFKIVFWGIRGKIADIDSRN